METYLIYKELLPFAAMIIVECTLVGSNILFKSASNTGVSNYVFTLYAYAIATIVSSPFAFIFYRRTRLPRISTSIVIRIWYLAMLGVSTIICVYKGLEYSSPTLASALGNLSSAFTFILAILFRMETVNLKSYSSVAKIIGTIIAISGALMVVLYKGQPILFTNNTLQLQSHPSTSSDWIIGGMLFALANFLLSLFYIIQSQTVRAYPAEPVVVFILHLFATIISASICFIVERNSSAWRITDSTVLISAIYTGSLGSSFCSVIHAWALRLKGPVYVALFDPLSIAIATFMGIYFLGETIYLGSVVGAVIIIIGFYMAMWGKMKTENINEGIDDQLIEPLNSDERLPLLQENLKVMIKL